MRSIFLPVLFLKLQKQYNNHNKKITRATYLSGASFNLDQNCQEQEDTNNAFNFKFMNELFMFMFMSHNNHLKV